MTVCVLPQPWPESRSSCFGVAKEDGQIECRQCESLALSKLVVAILCCSWFFAFKASDAGVQVLMEASAGLELVYLAQWPQILESKTSFATNGGNRAALNKNQSANMESESQSKLPRN